MTTGSAMYQPEQCDHPRQAVRRFRASNGVIHHRMQCLECGGRVRDLGKRDLLSYAPGDITEWDESIRVGYWERQREQRQQEWESQRAEYDAEREASRAAWWAWYGTYLESSAWWQKRARVLERDGRRCQAAVDDRCVGEAAQAHHLTYDHAGFEPLFDLVSVCIPCHDFLTQKDRERREQRGA